MVQPEPDRGLGFGRHVPSCFTWCRQKFLLRKPRDVSSCRSILCKCMRQFCSCGFAGLRAVSSLRYFCAFWHFVVAFVVAMAARGEQMFQEEEDMFGTKKEHRNPLVLCGAFPNLFDWRSLC